MINDLGIAGLSIVGVGVVCAIVGWYKQDMLGDSAPNGTIVVLSSTILCAILCVVGTTLLIVGFATSH